MVILFGVRHKLSLAQAETRKEPTAKLFGRVFKVHLTLVFWRLEYLLIKRGLRYSQSCFSPPIFCASTRLNVFQYLISLTSGSTSEATETFDMQSENPTSSPFTVFSILPSMQHGTWSPPSSGKQLILEMFIGNPSTYFFSLHPLGF